jgi:hypothetical protein
MKAISPRPITMQEAAVLRQALLRAALSPVPEEMIQAIDALRVKGECACGCRSVEFDVPKGNEHRLADGVGYLRTGERVDIIIWGRGRHIASLEIVDHQGAGKLPEAESVCSWEEAGRNAF